MNLLKKRKVATRKKTFAFVTVSVTVLSLLMTLAGPFGFSAVAAPPDTVTICHATGSNSNPYVVHNPAKSGDVSGHDGHNGPVWFEGIGEEWGDIIPPFEYESGSYPGKNWTEAGQAFYNNSCNIPAPPPVESTLTLEKIIDVDGDATPDNFVPSIVEYDGEVTWGVPVTLDPGDYTADELALVDDYEAGDWGGDCDANGNVLLGEGENLTCTITNTFVPPPIPGCMDEEALNFNPEATVDDQSCEYPQPNFTIFGWKFYGAEWNWENVLPDWTINLFGDEEDSTVTNVEGYYEFIVGEGEYTVCEDLDSQEAGWINFVPGG